MNKLYTIAYTLSNWAPAIFALGLVSWVIYLVVK